MGLEKKHKVGLSLSGGGARGIAHLGVIKLLEENDMEPQIVSGASMGAIIGCLYCSGIKVEEILNIFEKEKINKVFSIDFNKLGVLKHSFLSNVIDENVKADTFEELEKEFYVSVTNLNKGVNELKYTGELKRYVIASAAIPIVFRPVVIDDTWYVDGGLTDNLPAEILRNKSIFLVGSHVNYKPVIEKFSSFRDITERSFRIAIYNTIEDGYKTCDFVFDPPEVRDFGTFDLNKYMDIFEVGYNFAKSNLPGLKKKFKRKKGWF